MNELNFEMSNMSDLIVQKHPNAQDIKSLPVELGWLPKFLRGALPLCRLYMYICTRLYPLKALQPPGRRLVQA